MSKKERIEYLESEVAGLHSRIAELVVKVEELEKKQAGNWLFPNINIPAPTLPQTQNMPCAACARGGICSCVRPNQWTTTTISN
jgi:hypothetical protein